MRDDPTDVDRSIRPLGRVGLWTRQLDTQPGRLAEEAVVELEELGYRTLWIPEAVEREVISHAALLLAASRSIVIATGIARVHARSPVATALAHRLLSERFPARFLLGLGVSHAFVVERLLGQSYGSPLATMRDYLDAIDMIAPTPRVLAALGPKMLALAAERSLGAHTYMAPVEHTAWARQRLGDTAILAPAIKAVLSKDRAAARDLVRPAIAQTARVPAYSENLRRAGFGDVDAADDSVVDALVAIGDVGAIVDRVAEHIEAGADHVCVEVLTGDDTTVPYESWRELAPALQELG